MGHRSHSGRVGRHALRGLVTLPPLRPCNATDLRGQLRFRPWVGGCVWWQRGQSRIVGAVGLPQEQVIAHLLRQHLRGLPRPFLRGARSG